VVFRTLLASFKTMVLPLLIAAGILLILKSRSARASANGTFYTGVLLLAAVDRVLRAGMIAAILHGGGHFYSVQFDG